MAFYMPKKTWGIREKIAKFCSPLRIWIKWDQNKLNISPDELRKQLRDGDPSIQTVGNKNSVGITTWMMVPGQETIVSQKIKSILENSKNS